MKIAVIGSRGFIGTHLCEYFSQRNHELLCCDFSTPGKHSSDFLVDKINPVYDTLFQNRTPDICIYAGGNGSVPYSMVHPDIDFRLNTLFLERVLESIRKFSTSTHFLHISSAAVYGNPQKLPVHENDKILPLSPYGWNKYLSEEICREYTTLFGIHTLNIRAFSVYGDGLRKQLFWDLSRKLRASDHAELFGTGEETRDFIHISDLVKAIECVIHGIPFDGRVINTGSGTETTIAEASRIFCSAYMPDATITFTGTIKPGDPLHWKADISRLLDSGFVPSVTLRDGLTRYAEWSRKEN
ncbi:MAG: NAD-dependent epimerase/dehydratase family protein [Bacteroidia bacterium]|nr:NAD-dependent epimerase/dehydratase family protein [Bacteroidia bacterium]